MIVRKVDGVYRGTGRGLGKPDIVIVRGDKHWDIYEVHDELNRVLVASNLPFAEARVWDENGYTPPEPQPEQRKTRKSDGLHEFGPIRVEKVGDSWRVFSGDIEFGSGLVFPQAKRLANIQERKYALSLFRLAMSFVPHSCRNINLHRKLAAAHWRRLSRDAYIRANGQCEICGEAYPRLDCHEAWGYDDFRHIQRLDRLMAICFLCHRAIHFNTSYLWTETAWCNVVNHFKAVNQIDGATMSKHQEAAEWLYNMRGETGKIWTVDFGDWAKLVASPQE